MNAAPVSEPEPAPTPALGGAKAFRKVSFRE